MPRYYLDPSDAIGCPYCLDPDSADLRELLRAPPVRIVNSAEFAADLGFFRQLLADACAGYDRLIAHSEYDADIFFADWRRSVLTFGSTVDIRTVAFGSMAELQRMALNAHLVIVGADTSAGRPPPDEPYTWRQVDDTAVIRLATFQGFQPDIGARLEQFVADYPRHAASDRILFDLRGNSGGNLTYIHRWIAQARATKWQSYPYVEIYGRIAPCTTWNYTVEWQIRNESVDSAEAIAERHRLADEWPSLVDAPPTRRFDGWRPADGRSPFQGPVYVLVDRFSGSSGERAAIDLQRALGAVLLGEPTAGAMQYTEARRFVFPETGVQCTVPIKRHEFGREIEGVGWPVDIALADIDMDATGVVRLLAGL